MQEAAASHLRMRELESERPGLLSELDQAKLLCQHAFEERQRIKAVLSSISSLSFRGHQMAGAQVWRKCVECQIVK